MRVGAVCVVIAALLFSAVLEAQNVGSVPAVERLDQLQTALRKARAASDWVSYLENARQIRTLLNGSPQSRLEVARAETHAGHPAAAMDELVTYARMGQSSEVIEKLADFEPLRRRKEFDDVRSAMAANLQPVARATLAFRISDAGLLPEDIDFDPRSRRFYISSVLQHRIVSTDDNGALTEFAKSPDDWPVLALKIDAGRRVLWATEVALNGQGRSAVLCYDLNTGKLLRRIEGPRPSALGDLALAPNGGVILSDGDHGGLYRLEAGKNDLERLDRGDFISPQTVAISPDGAKAYVPDYVRGLGVLDFRTKQVRWLPTSQRFALDGIDGLYRVGKQQLIAIQNGTSPERVMIFSTDAAEKQIVEERIVERATTTLGDPTHGVMVEGVFYYIANSGWDSLQADGSVKPGATLTPAIVMKWKVNNP